MFILVPSYFMEFVSEDHKSKVVEIYKKYEGKYPLWYANRQARRMFNELLALVDKTKPGFGQFHRFEEPGDFYSIEAEWEDENGDDHPHMASICIKNANEYYFD